MIEIDITYHSENYIEEQCFLVNGDISVCNYINGWGSVQQYAGDKRTLFKQLVQCLKEGINFQEYGIPQKIKIFSLGSVKSEK